MISLVFCRVGILELYQGAVLVEEKVEVEVEIKQDFMYNGWTRFKMGASWKHTWQHGIGDVEFT